MRARRIERQVGQLSLVAAARREEGGDRGPRLQTSRLQRCGAPLLHRGLRAQHLVPQSGQRWDTLVEGHRGRHRQDRLAVAVGRELPHHVRRHAARSGRPRVQQLASCQLELGGLVLPQWPLVPQEGRGDVVHEPRSHCCECRHGLARHCAQEERQHRGCEDHGHREPSPDPRLQLRRLRGCHDQVVPPCRAGHLACDRQPWCERIHG